MVDIKADSRGDYLEAAKQLDQDLANQSNVQPKKVNSVFSFFYDLGLCKYAMKNKNENLKKQCLKAFFRIQNTSLISEIATSIPQVFGDEENPLHLSIYTLAGYRCEVRIILYLIKHSSRYKEYKIRDGVSIKDLCNNYKKDLCSKFSFSY